MSSKGSEHHIVSIVLNRVIGDSRVIKTAQAAINAGYRATIIGFSETFKLEQSKIGDIDLVQVPNPRKRLKKEGLWPETLEERDMSLFNTETAKTMLPIVAKLAPSVLHTHDMYGLQVGGIITRKLTESGQIFPWVHDIHEYVAGLRLPENYRRVGLEAEKRYLLQTDALITVSEMLAEFTAKEYRLTKQPVVTFNCPYRSEFTSDFEDIRSKLGLSSTTALIAYVGGITKERGANIIVESLPLLPGVHVCFVSNANNQATDLIKRRTAELDLADRVHFLPYVPADKVSSFVRTADLGIHPMLHFPNGEVAMPNKLFEYLHARLPVVVSDVASMSHFVRQTGVGEVFTAENAESCAAAIRAILKKRGSYKRRITKKLLDTYSWESQEREVQRIYADLLEKYRPRPAAHEALAKGVPLRVMHGVTTSAGQPHSVASSLREIGVDAESVRVFRNKSGLVYHVDRAFDVESSKEVPAIFSRIAPVYDVFHFYSRPFLLDMPAHGWPTFQDILALRAAGKAVIMNYRGSEIRLDSVFRENSPFNWIMDLPDLQKRFPEQTQRRFMRILSGICSRTVVLDPEMQTYAPDALVIPRSIDLSQWKHVGQIKQTRPVVVHAPTNRVIKGTDAVLAAVAALRNAGLDFEFRLIENQPSEVVQDELAKADIVIDQLRAGWYGVISVEAMALGKTVVCYIADKFVESLGCDGLPLAIATPEDLRAVLQELICSPSKRARLGARGRAYCEAVHDSRKIAQQYKDVYEDAVHNPAPFDFAAFREILKAPPALQAPKPRAKPIAPAAAKTAATLINPHATRLLPFAKDTSFWFARVDQFDRGEAISDLDLRAAREFESFTTAHHSRQKMCPQRVVSLLYLVSDGPHVNQRIRTIVEGHEPSRFPYSVALSPCRCDCDGAIVEAPIDWDLFGAHLRSGQVSLGYAINALRLAGGEMDRAQAIYERSIEILVSRTQRIPFIVPFGSGRNAKGSFSEHQVNWLDFAQVKPLWVYNRHAIRRHSLLVNGNDAKFAAWAAALPVRTRSLAIWTVR